MVFILNMIFSVGHWHWYNWYHNFEPLPCHLLENWNCCCILAGSQSLWLQQYRALPKITEAFAQGERAAVCNLLQNPARMPVCGVFCPALLRSGKLWVMHRDGGEGDDTERYLLPEEHLTLMSVPMFPECSGKHHFPHINCDLPAGAKRSLAGNVS